MIKPICSKAKTHSRTVFRVQPGINLTLVQIHIRFCFSLCKFLLKIIVISVVNCSNQYFILNFFSAILLLMEPEIAVELLYTVDRLGIEKNNFVYILIARTPFFNTSIIDDAVQNMGAQTYESILVLHPIFNVTNIFNNVTFELIPHDDVQKSLRDAATCILQGAYNKNSTVNNTLYLRKQESIVDILETKFVRGGEPFEYDANRERYFSFALLDIEEQLWKLTISKLMYKLNGKWNIRRISDIDWTNDKVILPDPCFKNTNCTPEEGNAYLANSTLSWL